MNEKIFTFEEKIKWLNKFLNRDLKETDLHGPGQFETEINQEFKALYDPTKTYDFEPLKFKKYSSIENTYRSKEIDRITEQGNSGGVWRLSEKVHGCLTWDTLVDTMEYGNLPIGKIIDEQIKCKVKSLNIDTGEFEYKRVLKYSIKEDNSDWYEIKTNDGQILNITGSHYVWLPLLSAWRKVEDLCMTDEFLID